MTTLNDVINADKVKWHLGSNRARGILHNCLLDKVNNIKAELQTKHLVFGGEGRFLNLSIALGGASSQDISISNVSKETTSEQPTFGDATTATTSILPNMSTKGPRETHLKEIDELKKELEERAKEHRKKFLDTHSQTNANNLKIARANFNKILDDSLLTIHLERGHILNGQVEVRLPGKVAADFLRSDPQLWSEYQELCCRSLEKYQNDLKRQYRQQLESIELECRDWMKAQYSNNLNQGDFAELTNAITKATQFKAQMPDISKLNDSILTQQEIDTVRAERKVHFMEQSGKDIADGGMSFTFTDETPEPLFDDHPQANDSPVPSMVGVSAAFLPVYQSAPTPSNSRPSAALSIIDRNKSSSRPVPLNDISSLIRVNGIQAQGWIPKNSFAYNFTPINRPYISPYSFGAPNQSVPALVPRNQWYNPPNKPSADNSAEPPSNTNTLAGSQHKGVLFGQASGVFGQNTQYPSNSPALPRAGIFKLPTISQPTPQRISPKRISPVEHLEKSVSPTENEISFVRRSVSVISTSNVIPGPRRMDSSFCGGGENSYVDTSLYDADYDDDEAYVPPPAFPDQDRQKDFDPSYNDGSVSYQPYQPPQINVQNRFGGTTYDDDDHSVPQLNMPTPQPSQPSKLIHAQPRSRVPSQAQQAQYLNTNSRQTQPRYNMRSHSPPTQANPFIAGRLQQNDHSNTNGEQPDYEPSTGGELPDYEDFDEDEVDTSRYLSGVRVGGRATVGMELEKESSIISISSDDDEVAVQGFGTHIDPHASQRGARASLTQSNLQSHTQNQSYIQNQSSNFKREASVLPGGNGGGSLWAGIGNVVDPSAKKNTFQQRFRGKTISQVMQLLKAEGDMKMQGQEGKRMEGERKRKRDEVDDEEGDEIWVLNEDGRVEKRDWIGG